ncbi:MAG: hypothetical protein HYX53_05505 [Chloroflexi bacterium]|nr:hypothetical protein [Chloroflexota bacterium]
MRTAIVGALAFVAIFAASCGGSSTPDTKNPDALNDEGYLKVFCTGLTEYQDALVSKTTKEDIARVITGYIASLKTVTPPDDLAKFHAEYIKYLEDAVADPTSLVTRKPPMPSDSARERLASKTNDVPECKYPTFLGQGSATATASP